MYKYLYLFISLLFFGCVTRTSSDTVRQNTVSENKPIAHGVSLVAPPDPFPFDYTQDIQAANGNWVAIIPYGFCRTGNPEVYFNMDRQWWGEREAGVLESIRLAKSAGLHIMLKPQLWIPGSWPGDLEYSTPEQQAEWEKGYREFILHFARIAHSTKVDLYCIGTEFKRMETTRESFWRTLIKDVKQEYQGKLTYAANWDSYNQLPFWDELDYIGIDAYFPLSDDKQPGIKSLKKAWQPIVRQVQEVQSRFDKPILFTEYGYMSVDGCTGKTWELEPNINRLPANEQAQADALQALYETWSPLPFWHGGFIWKWYPYDNMYKDHPNDYSPQGKKAEGVFQSIGSN